MVDDTPVPEASAPATRSGLIGRVVGAVRLRAATFEEIEHDPPALWQAALVVGLAGVARGLVAVVDGDPVGIVGSIIVAYFAWLIVCTVLWIVGVVIDRDTSTFFELLRTIGFAAAPILLLVVAAIPGLASPSLAIVAKWITHLAAAAALVIAARQALDVSTARAVVICGVVVAILAVTIAYVLHGVAVRLDALIDLVVTAAAKDG
jgi:hypothetical protein